MNEYIPIGIGHLAQARHPVQHSLVSYTVKGYNYTTLTIITNYVMSIGSIVAGTITIFGKKDIKSKTDCHITILASECALNCKSKHFI